MPGVAFPPVGSLGLGSPPSTVLCSAQTAPCPSRVASLALAAQYLVCFLALCSLRLVHGRKLPSTPGLLVNRYPSSSGSNNKETGGSPKFPSFPSDDRLRSLQTPVVSCSPRHCAGRIAAFHSRQSVGVLPSFNGDYPPDHDYTHFGAPSRSLSSRYPRLRTAPYEIARGFTAERLARRCSGGTGVLKLAPTGKH
jgi:hypothetical protein